jgi:homogentisate 1,2-dioxygenase
VLTCPSDDPGTAVADFVIFPTRWMVCVLTYSKGSSLFSLKCRSKRTHFGLRGIIAIVCLNTWEWYYYTLFAIVSGGVVRYTHLMHAQVWGAYDAKEGAKGKSAFLPGGASLHSCCSAHGPDETTFTKASNADLTVR